MLAYEVHGAGEPLVLIHGWCGSRSLWRLQLPALAARHRVIAVDLRGHGDSDKPERDEEYSIALCGSDIAALLDTLGIERAIVMGQSMGALIGLQFCLSYPQRVSALVLAGALAGSPPAGNVVGPWVEQIMEEIQARGFETYLHEVVPFWFSPGFDPERVRTFTGDCFKTSARAALAFCRAVAGIDLRERLFEIRVPTLLIVGERDGRTPVSEAEDMNRRIPDAWLKIVKGAGHMANVERPEEWNRAVLAFLGAVR